MQAECKRQEVKDHSILVDGLFLLILVLVFAMKAMAVEKLKITELSQMKQPYTTAGTAIGKTASN